MLQIIAIFFLLGEGDFSRNCEKSFVNSWEHYIDGETIETHNKKWLNFEQCIMQCWVLKETF